MTLAGALLLAGCGRRATALDCRLIVDKSVELQVREADAGGGPDDLRRREARVRGELEDELKACEGRRVTDRTMACVQAAATTQDLDKCLR